VEHHGFPDEAAKTLRLLDIDGMSSEDSEGEPGTRHTFRIKQLPWRSDELTVWLHRIDKMPLKNKGNEVLAHRMEQRRRVTSDKTSDACAPPHGLLTNFYKSKWLDQQDKRFVTRLGISRTKLVLPVIDEYVPTQY